MKKRHGVLALLASLSVITYLDRVCISVAGPRMQADLRISPDHWGWILGVFVLAYGLFEIPSGALGDRWGQRKVLLRIVLWWSVFTSLTGLARNFLLMVVIRFLFGAGEAGSYPNMSGSIRRWFPASERARAQGVVWGASRVGGALSPWLVVPLMTLIGWRYTFLAFGGLGVLWAVVWARWYHDRPVEQPNIRSDELAELEGELERENVPWRRLMANPQLWLIMAMFSCYVWGSIFYLTWFPTYLVQGRGFSEKEMGLFAALPFAMGAGGNFFGGYISDRLGQRLGLMRSRRYVGTLSLSVSALLLILTAMTTGKIAAIVCLSAGFGIMDCMLPIAWAMCLDLGGAHAGAVAGAMNSAGQAGGFICTLLFGYLVKAYGNYDLPLVVIAGMVLVSAALFWRIDVTKSPTRVTGAEIPSPRCA